MARKDDSNIPMPLELQVQVPENMQRGTYANKFITSHTPEEFILDFIMASPPSGIVNARVVVAPAHAKRIAAALAESVSRYEASFGEIKLRSNMVNPAQKLTH